MRLKEKISYLLAIDYLKGGRNIEKALMAPVEKKIGGHALPTEGGLETAMRIYLNRLRVVYGYPVHLFLRWSGIDKAYQRYIINKL